MARIPKVIKDIVLDSPLDNLAREAYGYYVRDKNQVDDALTLRILKKGLKNGGNGIDVGAHKGSILKCMVRYSPTGTHYAFEPIPALCEGLKKSYPGVRVFNYALSDTTGSASFNHVTNLPGYSGLRQRSYDREPIIEQITVHVERLDNIYPEEAGLSVVKIDVEGGEYHVLKGAEKTIRNNRPVVVFEFASNAPECYGVSSEMMFDLLEGYDMRISTLRGYLKNRPALAREDFRARYSSRTNCYFVAHP